MPTTPFRFVGTVADLGDSDSPWAGLTNLGANDGSNATCLIAGTGAAGSGISNTLKCTNFTGISTDVPAGATITGIQVRVRAFASSQGTGANVLRDFKIFLVIGGVVQSGTTNKAPAQTLATTATDYNYGSTSDLWGNTPTQAQVVASGFGVSLQYSVGSLSRTLNADSVQIAITYTTGATVKDVTVSGAVTLKSTPVPCKAKFSTINGQVVLVGTALYYKAKNPTVVGAVTLGSLPIPSKSKFSIVNATVVYGGAVIPCKIKQVKASGSVNYNCTEANAYKRRWSRIYVI